MPSLGTITLVGKSGSPYKFKAFPVRTAFKKGLAAVYVMTRRKRKDTGVMRHRPLLVGHSADLSRHRTVTPNVFDTIANCICVLAEPDEKVRLTIAQDLTAAVDPRRTR